MYIKSPGDEGMEIVRHKAKITKLSYFGRESEKYKIMRVKYISSLMYVCFSYVCHSNNNSTNFQWLIVRNFIFNSCYNLVLS